MKQIITENVAGIVDYKHLFTARDILGHRTNLTIFSTP